MARKYNAERAIRGHSHRKGGARISDLKAKAVKAKLVKEAEFDAKLDVFIDEQIAKNDLTTDLSDLATFLLKD